MRMARGLHTKMGVQSGVQTQLRPSLVLGGGNPGRPRQSLLFLQLLALPSLDMCRLDRAEDLAGGVTVAETFAQVAAVGFPKVCGSTPCGDPPCSIGATALGDKQHWHQLPQWWQWSHSHAPFFFFGLTLMSGD
jgi:hypothetical protein